MYNFVFSLRQGIFLIRYVVQIFQLVWATTEQAVPLDTFSGAYLWSSGYYQ